MLAKIKSLKLISVKKYFLFSSNGALVEIRGNVFYFSTLK